MAKTKEKTVVEEVSDEANTISPITVDFGRADLNQLRDAVNELIARS
jgi:hypothetical protein